MITTPLEFHGLVTFARQLVDQLHAQLREKEIYVSKSILEGISPLPKEIVSPLLSPTEGEHLSMGDAIELFGKTVHIVASSAKPLVPSNAWEEATSRINNVLWEYVELLEGCVTELFQQLAQTECEQWGEELQGVVEEIQKVLNHTMEDLYWKIQKLESLLWEYRWACQGKEQTRWSDRIFFFWKSLLDRSLLNYLKKSRQFLNTKYAWFLKRYQEYLKLRQKVEEAVKKFDRYQVFATLRAETQKDSKKLYQLLKLWTLNQKSHSIPDRDPVRALRSAFSIDRALYLFKEYFAALEEKLYTQSRNFKREPDEVFLDPVRREQMSKEIVGICAELHTLGAIMGHYRNFFLSTHPNPYVRTRWGFAEWIVGPEPKTTKDLLTLIYDVEQLDKQFIHLKGALLKGPSSSARENLSTKAKEINHILHEMGQPLSSKSLMKSRGEKLMDLLSELDELGSFDGKVVEVVGKIFSKALHVDWQYHVLFDLPLFHKLFAVHRGIVGRSEEEKHTSRLAKFGEVIDRFKRWVANRSTRRNLHEVEQNIHDLQEGLQNFLGLVQNTASREDLNVEQKQKVLSEWRKQLLDYRYQFGELFHLLSKQEEEGGTLRPQLLFVDQYLEAAENLITKS